MPFIFIAFIWICQERRQTTCLWWLAMENVHEFNSSFLTLWSIVYILSSVYRFWTVLLWYYAPFFSTFQIWECNLWKRPGFVQFTVISFLLPEYCLVFRLSPWSLLSSVLVRRGGGGICLLSLSFYLPGWSNALSPSTAMSSLSHSPQRFPLCIPV